MVTFVENLLYMYKALLKSADDLEEFIIKFGFLPYFKCGIPGFSVEEMTDPSLLWDDNGPWIWKGEITRRLNCAYGKFCKRRAAYISIDLLPYFLSYRRYIYSNYNKTTSIETDRKVLQLIRDNDSILSTELKKQAGCAKPKTSRLSPLEKLTQVPFTNVSNDMARFDTIITRLQMAGYVVIADFEYKYDKQGNPYGMGVARYTTPEALYGADVARICGNNPWEAYETIMTHLQALKFPGANLKLFDKLISF